ncbi:MAG TPA: hypothetical protein VK465_02955 [Fibrobacteria bacterium]|nr:hypothetical protein [Fibrobacteria bacterium]
MFTQHAKPLTLKESKVGPSGKNEAGEVKKERVTLRMLLDKERQEELEEARKAKLHQPEVKEEKKSAGSQSPESLRASQPPPRVRVKRKQFDKNMQALPTIPERKAIVHELRKTQTEDGRLVYREVQSSEDHLDFPVKPEGPRDIFGLSTIHEDFVLGNQEVSKPTNKFVRTFQSAMQGLTSIFTRWSTGSADRN